MRAKQLKKIKVRLEEMQAEILGESEETVHAMQEESTLYPDPNDRASLETEHINNLRIRCLLYTSPSPRDRTRSRMPSSA